MLAVLSVFAAVLVVFVAQASAFTKIETGFRRTALPDSLAKYGEVLVEDGLSLTTSTARFNRVHLRTVADDFIWAGSDAPVAFTFTLDTFTNTDTRPGTLSLIVVGDEMEGNGHIPLPDYTPASILGISLAYNAATGKYDLAFNAKTNAPRAGFTGKYFRRAAVNDIASVNLGTFGFIISPDNTVSLIANGQLHPEVFTLPANIAGHFKKNARVYLVATNRDQGQPASFKISSLSIKKENA
jgi:hypothetical protein